MGVRVFGHVIFDGTDLSDFGITLSGTGTYNSPERDVNYIPVSGKNGDVIMDNWRFQNITVTYPINIEAGLPEKVNQLNAFLMSHQGYYRLEDSYHPDEFRLAQFAGPIEINSTGRHNRYGRSELIFNCCPQRFLKSGEIALPQITGTGTPLSILVAQGNPREIFDDDFIAVVGEDLLVDKPMTVLNTTSYSGDKVVLHYTDERLSFGENVIYGDASTDPTSTSGGGVTYGGMGLYNNDITVSIVDNYTFFETPAYYEVIDGNGDLLGSIYPTQTTIYNPTLYDAKPLIRVHFSSNLTTQPVLMINEASITLTASTFVVLDSITTVSISDIYIDCETMDVYAPMSGYKRPYNLNGGAYIPDNVVLKAGYNIIRYNDSVDYIEIIPRWYTI